MSIFDIVKEALRIGRAHKSLWLFGFMVGLGGGGGSSGVGAWARSRRFRRRRPTRGSW